MNVCLLGVIIFDSVWFLSKKVTKPKNFFEKKPKPNRNRVKPTGFGSVWFGFLGQKPVQTGLARFFWFWLGFLGFGSVLARFGSVFFRFFVGFGSVRFFWFFAYTTETEPNRPVFSKI
jgi:hypothetical protein